METTAKSVGILWGRVVAIALVQAALTLMWIVYNAYLGDLLQPWGFTAAFTEKLLFLELLLGLAMEPIFGLLSDQQQRTLGSRTPLIVLGIILAAGSFVLLPLFALLQLPFRWILPTMAIAWALAMTTFRTPIYVLLLKSAPAQELPLAMSVLTMTGGLMALQKETMKTILLGMGAMSAFLVGSIVLLAASTFLRFYLPPPQPPAESQDDATPDTRALPWVGIGKTVLMAIALAWGTKVLMTNVTHIFSGEIFGANPHLMSLLNICLALGAIPIAWLWRQYKDLPLLAIALTCLWGILMILLAAPPIALLYLPVAALWVVAFATLKNGTLPFIFASIPSRWSGFGIGVFFGVTGLANQLFPSFIPTANPWAQGSLGLVTLAIAAMLAMLPFLASQKLSSD